MTEPQKQFIDGYLTAALWSSTDDESEPLDDNYTIDDIAPESLTELKKAAVLWFDNARPLIDQAAGYSYEQAGHDFWLTRNGHGAGFWDRGLDSIGDKLTDLAQNAGTVNLYIGDDGLIYAYPY